jgi:hypothetical protein
MQATNPKSDAVAAGHIRIAKRPASEELEDAPDIKRIEHSEAPPTISDDHEPKPTFRVPFLEKVCHSHTNKDMY